MAAKYWATWASVCTPNLITYPDGICKRYLFTLPKLCSEEEKATDPASAKVCGCSFFVLNFCGSRWAYESQLSSCLNTALAKQYADPVGHSALCSADKGHLETGGPPRANCNQGFRSADSKVGSERDDCRSDDRLDPMHEEEGYDRNTCPNRCGESAGTG